MGREVVPISTIARRLPEAGRIRLGVKTKNAMKSIDTFRFTSQDRASIEQVAEIYGGKVEPWSDPKAVGSQWQVITEANELRIALPPDPLGGTPIYEMWGGGGCERRCDGETVERYVNGADGIDIEASPCICLGKGVLECRAITRLSVLLPEVRFIGVWRLDTKSMNAAQELPGMVELIQSLQSKGITRAVLRVERREQRIAGRTNKFVVPVLGLDASVEQLAAGTQSLGALGPAPVAELAPVVDGPGEGPASDASVVAGVEPGRDAESVPVHTFANDDEIVDAEIIDDETARPAPAQIAIRLGDLGVADRQDRLDYVTGVLRRTVETTKDLAADDVKAVLAQIAADAAEPMRDVDVKEILSGFDVWVAGNSRAAAKRRFIDAIGLPQELRAGQLGVARKWLRDNAPEVVSA